MATNLTIDEVTQNVTLVVSNERGPAGPAGPNSVTSATTSDGTATLSLAAATITGTLTSNHIHGNLAGSIYLHVRAGEALSKGDPVYVSGSHGTGAAMVPIVSRADASNAAKMPAIAIMDAAVANNGDGHAVINGTITDLNTQAYAINSTLYVANGGGMTATKPANAQPVARVDRSNLNNGGIVVKVNGLYSDVTIASSQVTDATNAATAGTIVKRNGGGSAAFGSVTANTFDGDANAAFVNLGGGSNFISVDNGSDTPIFNFISLATAAATRTYTLPDATGTVILDSTLGAGVNGLSTITGAKSFSGQVQLTGQAATDANSAMTRGLADARLASPHAFTTGSPTTGPWGGNQLVLQPFTFTRPDITSCFVSTYGSSPPEVRFVPFWVATPRTVTTAVIRITGGTNATQTVRAAIYDVDGNGMPNTRISPQWDFSCAATGVVTQAIGASVYLARGLYWVALQNSVGGTLWGSPALTVHGYSEPSSLAHLNLILGSLLSTFGQYHSGSVPNSYGGTSMPATASGFPNRGNGSANVTVPLVGLY
jgi:hypothetical protein